MVYTNRFVVCVLQNGCPLQELSNGIVPIDFGSEYVLRFRNKNNRRAVVKFTIDGEDASGPGYIIPAHGAIDILRYHHKDAAFKFVSLESHEAIDHGKNGPNFDGQKGVISARFYLEKEYPQFNWSFNNNIYRQYPPVRGYPNPFLMAEKVFNDCDNISTVWKSAPAGNVMNCCNNIQTAAAPVAPSIAQPTLSPNVSLQEGCTVEGNATFQNFSSLSIDLETNFTSITCFLRGKTSPAYCNAGPVSTNQMAYCCNCGAKKSRSNDNFCGICGHKF